MSDTQRLDEFDRLQSLYEGLPQAIKTAPSTIRVAPFLAVEGTATWIVQTLRHAESGDFVFVERLTAGGPLRVVLPPSVVAVIARQRDALTFKARSRAARDRARTRPTDASHLADPKVRAKALATRRKRAEARKARRRQ